MYGQVVHVFQALPSSVRPLLVHDAREHDGRQARCQRLLLAARVVPRARHHERHREAAGVDVDLGLKPLDSTMKALMRQDDPKTTAPGQATGGSVPDTEGSAVELNVTTGVPASGSSGDNNV